MRRTRAGRCSCAPNVLFYLQCPFRLLEGEPLPTSYGQDLYQQVFGTAYDNSTFLRRPVVDVEVVVEIPQGSRNKYEVDHATGRIRLDRMLFTSTCCPVSTGSSPIRWLRTVIRWTRWSCSTSRPFPAAWCWPGRSRCSGCHDEHGPDAKILTVPARVPGDTPTYMISVMCVGT